MPRTIRVFIRKRVLHEESIGKENIPIKSRNKQEITMT
jgi:hypothetical protein